MSTVLSQISIDSFLIQNLFLFVPGKPIMNRSDQRAYTGKAHTNVRWFKDTFVIQFPKLTFQQYSQLMGILQQTGTNPFHTVLYYYESPSGVQQIRQYDGLTAYAAGYGINDDVQRMRSMCKVESIDFTHFPNQTAYWQGKVEFQEA